LVKSKGETGLKGYGRKRGKGGVVRRSFVVGMIYFAELSNGHSGEGQFVR